MTDSAPRIPKDFVWRRLHSILGLWLVAYLILHLFTNSQSALLLGENGGGFVKAVNDIHNLPYLPAIEIILLGVPFAIHGIWGIKYALTGKFNSYSTNGSTPALGQYPRNQAYSWQRITSWILLFLITFHVIHMRFMESPAFAQRGTEKSYMVRVGADPGLYPVAKRLGVTIYDAGQVQAEKQKLESSPPAPSDHTPQDLVKEQEIEQQKQWVAALEKRPLHEGQVIAMADNFGTAELLMVRETFKMPLMLILYTVLVISACFHAFNGLWTFMITWGATLSVGAQNLMRKIATFLMFLIGFLGLVAIWGTYWFNLKQ